MPLIFRKACLDDAPAVADLLARSWVAAYTGLIPKKVIARVNAKRPEQYRERFAGEHNCYVAVLDGRVAGLCGIARVEEADLPGWFRVGAFYVDPNVFRQGVGRQMMDFAIGMAREEGHPGVLLYVMEKNLRARRFYEACGFAHDGKRITAKFGWKRLGELRYTMKLEMRNENAEIF